MKKFPCLRKRKTRMQSRVTIHVQFNTQQECTILPTMKLSTRSPMRPSNLQAEFHWKERSCVCCQECVSSLRKSNLSFDSTDKYWDANINNQEHAHQAGIWWGGGALLLADAALTVSGQVVTLAWLILTIPRPGARSTSRCLSPSSPAPGSASWGPRPGARGCGWGCRRCWPTWWWCACTPPWWGCPSETSAPSCSPPRSSRCSSPSPCWRSGAACTARRWRCCCWPGCSPSPGHPHSSHQASAALETSTSRPALG